jgi:formate dehydrogenase subunit delta
MSSMSSVDRLVYMANQIARNMSTMNDMDTAAAIADHIKSFWDPRMLAGIKTADPAQLLPIVRQALAMVDGPVPHQTRATEFASVHETGHSDAG